MLFTKPKSLTYNKCKNYTERRLWILFSHIIPSNNEYKFRLVHCKECDLLFTSPRFDDQGIKLKYDVLVDLQSTKNEYERKEIRNINKRAKRIFSLISSYAPEVDKPRASIADIGGQFGNNLKFFDSDYYDKHVIDYEKYDAGPDISYLQPEWEKVDKSFDIILMNHTAEHFSFPTKTLQRIIAHLNCHGIIYIEVPLGAFREAYNIKEPLTHFNFYSEKSVLSQINQLGLYPLHLTTSYQWVTNSAEHCINIVAANLPRNSRFRNRPFKTPKTVSKVKHSAIYYVPLLLKKLLRFDPLAK